MSNSDVEMRSVQFSGESELRLGDAVSGPPSDPPSGEDDGNEDQSLLESDQQQRESVNHAPPVGANANTFLRASKTLRLGADPSKKMSLLVIVLVTGVCFLGYGLYSLFFFESTSSDRVTSMRLSGGCFIVISGVVILIVLWKVNGKMVVVVRFC